MNRPTGHYFFVVDDNFLKTFIYGGKGSIQKAKITLDNFFKVQCAPEIFGDFDPLRGKGKYFNDIL